MKYIKIHLCSSLSISKFYIIGNYAILDLMVPMVTAFKTIISFLFLNSNLNVSSAPDVILSQFIYIYLKIREIHATIVFVS